MPFNKKKNTGTPKRDYTKMKTPHTYAIIFAAIFLCWLLTFLVPAGKFSTHKVEYTDSNGAVKTKTVLMADTFRYSYRLDREAVKDNLTAMSGDEALKESLGVDPAELDAFLAYFEEPGASGASAGGCGCAAGSDFCALWCGSDSVDR